MVELPVSPASYTGEIGMVLRGFHRKTYVVFRECLRGSPRTCDVVQFRELTPFVEWIC